MAEKSNGMSQTAVYHGGNLQEAMAQFGMPRDDWLDLSTGINPTPYPNTTLANSALHQLPQTDMHDALRLAARRYYEVPEGSDIVAAPGSQAILQLLPAILPNRNVSILGPTYEEHEKLWGSFGHQVDMITTLSEINGTDTVVLVNPNNPDGRMIEPDELRNLAQSLPKPNGLLIVDEAFADTAPSIAIIPGLNGQPILSIRSFGKFFGLPGLRLGFAAGATTVVAMLRERLGPWAVSGPAMEIGTRALNDTSWIEQAREKLTVRAEALDQVLLGTGMTVAGGTALFRLVLTHAAGEIFERLGHAGIFVRRFPDRPNWLRFGVPGTDDEIARLKRALS